MTALPHGWMEVTLGDLGFWSSGGTPQSKKPEYYDGEIPWIRSGDLPNGLIVDHKVTITEEGLENSSAKWVAENSILVAMYGATIGKTGLTTYPVTTNQAIASCAPHAFVLPEFLFWGVRSMKDTLIKLGRGGAQPNISQRIIKSQPFTLPPLAEQQRIVDIIEGLTTSTDNARYELNRIADLSKTFKQQILTMASTGELINGFSHKIKRNGWKLTSVSGVSIKMFDGPFGSNLKSADYVETGVRVVRLENIGVLNFIANKETFISIEKFNTLKRHELKANDVLFSSFVTEEIRVCLLPDDLETVAINKADCFCIRVEPHICDPNYLAYYLASSETYDSLKKEVHGVTRPRISLKQLKKLQFYLPSLSEQVEIVRRVDKAFKWLSELSFKQKSSVTLLNKLDKEILSKAFRGELTTQNVSDEPAGNLVSRIRAEMELVPKPKRNRKPKVVKEYIHMDPKIIDVLLEANDWIPAQEIFRRCGINDGAEIDTIEALYAELRILDKAGRLKVEHVTDDVGRKLYDRLKLIAT